MWETQVPSLGQEDPLEKEMATQSSILAWRIPGTAEPWWASVYGVAQSRTRLKLLSSSSSIQPLPGLWQASIPGPQPLLFSVQNSDTPSLPPSHKPTENFSPSMCDSSWKLLFQLTDCFSWSPFWGSLELFSSPGWWIWIMWELAPSPLSQGYADLLLSDLVTDAQRWGWNICSVFRQNPVINCLCFLEWHLEVPGT